MYQEWLNDTTIWHYWTIFTQLQPFPPKKNHPGPQGLCPLKLDIPSTWLRYSLPWHQTKLLQIMVETPIQCRDCWYTDIPIKIAALYFCSSRVWCFWYLYWVILWQWWIEETTRLILTLVSFHEVVDEDTEMFWMFLRVSHIANCLRSMFHRIWHIWILMVFWCRVRRIIKHPHPLTLALSDSRIHSFTLSQSLSRLWPNKLTQILQHLSPNNLSDENRPCAMRFGTLSSPHPELLNLIHCRIWGYMDPLDESFLKITQTLNWVGKITYWICFGIFHPIFPRKFGILQPPRLSMATPPPWAFVLQWWHPSCSSAPVGTPHGKRP